MEMKSGRRYKQTEIWRVFEEKVAQEHLGENFVNGVGKICEKGESLSKTVIALFPTFTLHIWNNASGDAPLRAQNTPGGYGGLSDITRKCPGKDARRPFRELF